jgi:uncharacterized membrane protein
MVALGLVWWLNVEVPPDNGGISDLGGYQTTATAIAHGQWPYRDFFLEYPPVAAGLFVVAGWIGGLGATGFSHGMAIEMLMFAWTAQACAARLAPENRRQLVAWAFVVVPLLMGTLVRERFDVAPAAVCIAAVLALARGHHKTAFALLGAGIALKLFPAVLVPAGVGWLLARGLRREAWIGGAVAVAVALVICAPFYAVSPHGFTEQFRFHIDRPVQIESTPASVLYVLGGATVDGIDEHPDRFRSQGLVGGDAKAVKALFEALQFAAYVLLVGVLWYATKAVRGRPSDELDVLLLAVTGALLTFIALGKVFSPQYMIWLAPLTPLAWVRGQREVAALMTAAFVLTWAYYPHHYTDVVVHTASHHAAIVTVALRNGLLVGALGLVIARLWRYVPASIGRAAPDK